MTKIRPYNQSTMDILWSLGIGFGGMVWVRTAFWHLQSWQLREYRIDRMRAHLQTNDGRKNVWNLWFFRGIFPRPQKSGRIVMIIGFFGIVNLLALATLIEHEPAWNWFWEVPFLHALILIFLFERFTWLTTLVAVWMSNGPVWIGKKILFHQARNIVKNSSSVNSEQGAGNVIRIGITGSYGKSSTKEILVHLLQNYFGTENVLSTPENQNHEIAIARLIKKNASFFTKKTKNPRIFVAEMGAYKRGEIAQMCDFVRPQIGILTAVGTQHIELFGSQSNIQRGKFELAEGVSDKIFFNADNQLLNEIFNDRAISATPLGIGKNSAEKITSTDTQSTFHAYGQDFVLPWPEEFFIQNALLAIECARELDVPVKKSAEFLATLPPLKRALHKTTAKSGFTILSDLYSANPSGVFAAIETLGKAKGKKIFIGMPLLELGKNSAEIHQQIFEKIKSIDAEIYWTKSDHSRLAWKTCGKKFHQIKDKNSAEFLQLKQKLTTLKKNDTILLEGRLPEFITSLFS